jgi:hypothetical protein
MESLGTINRSGDICDFAGNPLSNGVAETFPAAYGLRAVHSMNSDKYSHFGTKSKSHLHFVNLSWQSTIGHIRKHEIRSPVSATALRIGIASHIDGSSFSPSHKRFDFK